MIMNDDEATTLGVDGRIILKHNLNRWEGVDCTDVAQVKGKLRDLVTAAMDIWVP